MWSLGGVHIRGSNLLYDSPLTAPLCSGSKPASPLLYGRQEEEEGRCPRLVWLEGVSMDVRHGQQFEGVLTIYVYL